jgi:hypothetical protein
MQRLRRRKRGENGKMPFLKQEARKRTNTGQPLAEGWHLFHCHEGKKMVVVIRGIRS